VTISWNTGLAAERARHNLELKKKKNKKPQATSGKPTPGGGGEKAFYKKVLDIRSGII
jgi:hypothetical protein